MIEFFFALDKAVQAALVTAIAALIGTLINLILVLVTPFISKKIQKQINKALEEQKLQSSKDLLNIQNTFTNQLEQLKLNLNRELEIQKAHISVYAVNLTKTIDYLYNLSSMVYNVKLSSKNISKEFSEEKINELKSALNEFKTFYALRAKDAKRTKEFDKKVHDYKEDYILPFYSYLLGENIDKEYIVIHSDKIYQESLNLEKTIIEFEDKLVNIQQ